MPNIFATSDPHYFHANTFLKFRVPDPHWQFVCPNDEQQCDAACKSTHPEHPTIPMRPFTSIDEMNEALVDGWNSVVRKIDKTYLLGDVVMSKKPHDLDILDRLNGTIVFIPGNHDLMAMRHYLKHVERVYSTRVVDGLLMSHIPVHPLSIGKATANVHGHVHNNQHRTTFQLPRDKYVNVCVEVTNYRPLSLEEIKQRIER